MRPNTVVLAVSAEGFLTRLGFGMVGFTLPLYAISLGMAWAEVGALYALSTAMALLIKPAVGWTADRFGAKRTLVASVFLRCLIGLLFVFATLPWHLYALRLVRGVVTAAREPSAASLISDGANRQRMATAFAWYATARDLGRSLGYAAAGALLHVTGQHRLVFFIAFLTSCSALVAVIRWVHQPSPGQQTSQLLVKPSGSSIRALSRRLFPYARFGVTVAAGAEMMRGLFPVIATEYAGLTAAEAGLIASVSSIAILLAGPAFAWISDHVSRPAALGARSFANTISSLLYAVFPGFSGFLAGRVLDDTGKAAFRPTWGALLAEVSAEDPARRTRVIAVLDSTYDVGEVVAPVIAGLLIGAFGVPVMLGVRAVLALIAEVQAIRLVHSDPVRGLRAASPDRPEV